MKRPLTYFILAATILLFIAGLPIGVSLKIRVVTAAVVACSAAFYFGVTNVRAVLAVPITTIYFFMGQLVPNTAMGASPGKDEVFLAYITILQVCFVSCLMLFGLGRLGRFVVTKYVLKH